MTRLAPSRQPLRLGIVAAIAATGAGIAVMAATGAPRAYLAVNAAALLIGLALLGLSRGSRAGPLPAGGLALAAATALLATALLGTTMAGAARWVQIGPVSLQPSLLLLPAMLMAYARHQGTAGTAAMVVAALALACQPDRAGAAALAAGLAALATTKADGRVGLALAGAIAALAVTLVRPDALAPSPYVERVFADAFAASLPAGAALVVGAALLLLPATGLPRPEARVFGATWLTLLLASVLGNFPTPLLGFGGSSVLGYLLGLAACRPQPVGAGGGTGRHRAGTRNAPPGDACAPLTP